MKNVVVDYRISKIAENKLKDLNFNVIKTIKNSAVQDAINGHPDIIMCKLSNCDICINTTYRGIFDNFEDINIIEGKSVLKYDYPYDIAYNAARVGNYLFCNREHTDLNIIDYCINNDIKILDIKQGYAKCSICVISNNAIITADKNIYSVAKENNIDVLLTTNDKIKLNGYKNGFIGGATGLLKNDLLAVNGNIKLLDDCKLIEEFCKNYGVSIISLTDDEIVDIGSIIVI